MEDGQDQNQESNQDSKETENANAGADTQNQDTSTDGQDSKNLDGEAGQKASDDQARDGKPEWMSDKDWDEKYSKIDGDLDYTKIAADYAQRYDNANKLVNTRKDNIRDEVKAEALQNRPESASKYEFSNEVLESLGLEAEIADDHPGLLQAKNFAFERGFSQEEFGELINMHLAGVSEFFPNWDDEKLSLGDHADDRAAYLNSWAGKYLTPDSYKAIEKMALSADMVVALEEIMELTGSAKFAPGTGQVSGAPTSKDEIHKLMDTDEYRNGDPATVKKVQAGFKRLSA